MCVVLLLALFSLATTRMTTAAEGQALVLAVEGAVEIQVKGGSEWKPARVGSRLTVGDRLRTGDNSRATLQLANRMRQRLAPSSTLLMEAPKVATESDVPLLQRGSLYFQSRKRPQGAKFRTPLVSGAIRGTEFLLEVAENGQTTLNLFDGEVELENDQGVLAVTPGEEASVAPGQAPVKTSVLRARNLIQWVLYYPAVLDPAGLQLPDDEQTVFAQSLEAYRKGDLPGALRSAPAPSDRRSDNAQVFHAALLLSAGEIEKARKLMAGISDEGAEARAKALRRLIQAVQFDPLDPGVAVTQVSDASEPDPSMRASELLAESYNLQARSRLQAALNHARRAVEISPEFGHAWARVAELEFSFGRTPEALTALERALELAPLNAQAHALNGFVLSARSRFAEAARAFETAIELDSALPTGWLGRGLVRISQGDLEAGRADLQTAAVLDPMRATFRGYLGKALAEEGRDDLADKEFSLSQRLDPNDPTSFLYSALLRYGQNRPNEAVRDLERSRELNDNRSVYRSDLLLDQDRAVRSANLALIYADAGMRDVSIKEASRAMQHDYANYSAHLFLANSLNEQRDLRGVNLRFESPTVTEFLVATLLSPVGSGTLAQSITAQEYSRFFANDRFGLNSATDYSSEGQWLNVNALYGETRSLSYALGSFYQYESGTRPNNDIDLLSLSASTKMQLTPEDTVFVEAFYTQLEAGDRTQYYDPSSANTTVRIEDHQEPNLIAGYHHEWAPGSHTLLLLGRLHDRFESRDPAQQTTIFAPNPFPPPAVLVLTPTADSTYENELEIYTAEAQQLWQGERHTLVAGALYQGGDFETQSTQGSLTGVPTPPFPAGTFSSQSADQDFYRTSLYGYHTWEIFEPLSLTTGLAYDHVHYPENYRNAPINNREVSRTQLSPKAGLVFAPFDDTLLRFAYTRSLGGVSFDQSFRIEPTQVGGLNQSFRSVIPESIVGAVAGPAFETWSLGLDQKFGRGTYAGVGGEILKSEANNALGAYTGIGVLTPVTLTEQLDFEERNVNLYVNQLLGDEWAVGANYRWSDASLHRRVVETGGSADLEATLQQLTLFGIFHHPSGFFARAESVLYDQSNRGFNPAIPGDTFWQHNLYAGYRFARRRAEIRLGVMNLADTDYRLNPLNPYQELPRERAFTASVRLSF